ncbi:hypothetical protein LAWI1_G007981 [Lachnellula willkommii]|uniref:Uncharacterized protein n=1 Tax=Lachnellula willkommii TaxID=215461 RepID=A0A559M1R3_9HELO|nr:hypothetical protein LAWI1_G007981 [Lachnellula willkommii]
MANINAHKHRPWGVTVPGRPSTPSEGAAYQYSRVGPRQSQRLFSFENCTCLEYGPDDPVDEFEVSHPFANQVAIIDKAIRDIKAVRDRYQRPARILSTSLKSRTHLPIRWQS